jgi:hypothetical protein
MASFIEDSVPTGMSQLFSYALVTDSSRCFCAVGAHGINGDVGLTSYSMVPDV